MSVIFDRAQYRGPIKFSEINIRAGAKCKH